jgi:hypothetical protein
MKHIDNYRNIGLKLQMENEHGEIITRGVPFVEIKSPRTFDFSYIERYLFYRIVSWLRL